MEEQKIITRRSRGLRFLFTHLLGGIGITEILILFLGFAIGIGLLIGFSKIALWAGVVMLLLTIIVTVILIVPFGYQKVYSVLIAAGGYLFAIKKIKSSFLSALYPIKTINEQECILINGSVIAVWSIATVDISLMDSHQRNLVLQQLADQLRDLNLHYEIIRIAESFDFEKQTAHLVALSKYHSEYQANLKKPNHIAQQMINYVQGYEMIRQDKNQKHSSFYIFVYGPDAIKIQQETQYRFRQFHGDVRLLRVTGPKLQQIFALYLTGTNELWPHKLQQTRYRLQQNQQYSSYHEIWQFPALVNDGWLFPFANLPGVNLSLQVYPLSNNEAIRLLDRAVMRARMNEPHKASDQIEKSTYLDHFNTMLELVKNGGESVKMVRVQFRVSSETLAEWHQRRELLIMTVANAGFTLNNLRYHQIKTFKEQLQSLPINTIRNNFQEMALNSLVSSFPFVPQTIQDPHGLFLGFNTMVEPVFFDVKVRNNVGRVNSNVLVLGMSGFGKTYNVSKQLNWLYLNKTRIFIIDPEREYHHFAKYYGGVILNIGIGSASRINPLEIFGDDLMKHIAMLEQFLRIMYHNLGDRDFAEWQKLMLAVYHQKNINDQTDFTKLTPASYPIWQDVYDYSELIEANQKYKSNLNGILWKLSQGADGRLWNGTSTLNLRHHDFVVFDTHDLSVNKNIENAQIFLMLTFLDKEIKLNKIKNENLPLLEQNWICIAIDEAHLLVNENNSLALNFLFQMTKRIRKYNGILYIISQNVNDFMGNEQIKTQTRGIINNCSYQFIHHLAPSDLQDYDNLVSAAGRLNTLQKDRITESNQGQCLFVINNQRTMLNISSFAGEEAAWVKVKN